MPGPVTATAGGWPINADPRDYQIVLNHVVALNARSDNSYLQQAESRVLVTYGNAYVPGIVGIEMLGQSQYQAGFAVGDSTFTFDSPWGAWSASYSSFVTSKELLLELDDVVLDAGCNEWEFSFSALRLYEDSVLVFSVGAQTQDGVGYDPREASPCEGRTRCINNPASLPALPTCAVSFSAQLTSDHRIGASPLVGYRWRESTGPGAWQEDLILIDSIALPSTVCPSPTCSTSLPAMTPEDTPATSWKVEIDSNVMHQETKLDLGTFECDCPPPSVTLQKSQFSAWSATRHIQSRDCSLRMFEKASSGIFETRRVGRAACRSAGGFEWDGESDSTATETDTYSPFRQYVRNAVTTKYCFRVTRSLICSIGFGTPPPPTEPCFSYADEYCDFEAEAILSHPTKPPCASGAKNVSYDVSDTLRHYVATVASDDTVSLLVSGNTSPLAWTTKAAGFSAAWVSLKVDRQSADQRLVLIYEDLAGDIQRRTSADEGGSWTVATTIATGKKPSHVIGRNGLLYVYWIDGTAIKGRIYDKAWTALTSVFTAVASGVDDQGIDVDERVTSAGRHQIVLVYVASGSVTAVVSDDGQSFS